MTGQVLPEPGVLTVADLLERRSGDGNVGLLAGDRSWTWGEVVDETRSRAAVALSLAPEDTDRPFHIGILLENVPEYLFWLGAAAIAGAVLVGINPTRRGAELARDITFTQCHLIVTDTRGARLLDELELDIPPERMVLVDVDTRPDNQPVACTTASDLGRHARRESLLLLTFTSGTTSAPKAVQCTQGRLADIAVRAAAAYGFRSDDICYCPMPLFHGNAVMALWAPALAVGAAIALTPRFSASGFVDDVRHYGATRFTYVGKALAYILATPERPDDADNPLTKGFGTEASARDRSEFERRFGCSLIEGYGSSEGGMAINRTASTPDGALGPCPDGVTVIDTDTGEECERARLGPDGRILNTASVVGEIVNTSGRSGFEGYWRHPEADDERRRNGWYWSGDLGYIDEDGFVWFAGRKDDWLRVDSENFAAAPIERIIERHPDVVAVAIYAVPDPRTGDQVMASVELSSGADPAAFAGDFRTFLAGQSDMGTKWAPRFVRIVDALPLTATGKITKASLRREAWACADPVYRLADRESSSYTAMSDGDVAELSAEFVAHGRISFDPGSVPADTTRRKS